MAAKKATKQKRKPAKARNRTIIKAKRVTVLAANPRKTRRIVENGQGYTLDIIGEATPTTRDGNKGWAIGRRFFATGRGTKKLTGGQSYLDLATGYVYKRRAANPKTKKAAATKPRRRNATEFSPETPISVRHYYRSGGEGYATKRERIIKQGQRDLFAPEASVEELLGYLRAGNPTVIGAVKKRLGAKVFATASPSLLKRTMIAILRERKAAAKAKAKPRKRNPNKAAREGFKVFTGKESKRTMTLNFPDGTPENCYVLGELVSLKLEGGAVVKPVIATSYLCADTRGHLHLGTADEWLTDRPKGEVGTIKLIEYLQAKPHLGYPEQTIFFHKAGEETGEKPTLHSDGKGGLLIKGGNYQITPEGIRN